MRTKEQIDADTTPHVVYWIHNSKESEIYSTGYVGITKVLKKRMREHRKTGMYGPKDSHIIIARGTNLTCRAIEKHLRPKPRIGRNKNAGGDWIGFITLTPEEQKKSHAKLSATMAARRTPKEMARRDSERKAYTESRKDETKAYGKAHYEENKEKINAANNARYELNSDNLKARYAENRDEIINKRKAYRAANKEKVNAIGRAYYEANREKLNAASKARRDADKEKWKAYWKAYREANKDKIRKQERECKIRNRAKHKANEGVADARI